MEEISAWKCIAVTRVEAHGLIFSKSRKRIAQGSTTSQHSNEQHRIISETKEKQHGSIRSGEGKYEKTRVIHSGQLYPPSVRREEGIRTKTGQIPRIRERKSRTD
jgi:hypothetical protein